MPQQQSNYIEESQINSIIHRHNIIEHYFNVINAKFGPTKRFCLIFMGFVLKLKLRR